MDAGRTSRTPPCVVAVDAGGTHTRAACFALDGTPLGRAEGPAGAWHHHDDAAQNLRSTVHRALGAAGVSADGVRALVAGVAGVSSRGSDDGAGGDRSREWAAQHLAVPELTCPQVFVNDAVTAHRGALLGRPGVIVVAGTGSMVMALAADGAEVENGQLGHYAGAARHLVLDVVHGVMAGRSTTADAALVAGMLGELEVEDVAALRRLALDLERREGQHAVTRRFGPLAPLVTAAADASPLAHAELRALAGRTATGVLLLAPLVGTDPVEVTTTGSLATHPAFTARLSAALAGGGTRVVLVPAATDAVRGAALMAFDLLGAVDDGLRGRLLRA